MDGRTDGGVDGLKDKWIGSYYFLGFFLLPGMNRFVKSKGISSLRMTRKYRRK